MTRALSPPALAKPFGRYSAGIAVPARGHVIAVSGQLAVDEDGQVPEGVSAQSALCLRAIGAVLAEAGAGPADVLRLNAYVTERAAFPAYMAARDAWLEGVDPPPASTLMIVSGFTRPEFLVEVEALAMRAG